MTSIARESNNQNCKFRKSFFFRLRENLPRLSENGLESTPSPGPHFCLGEITFARTRLHPHLGEGFLA